MQAERKLREARYFLKKLNDSKLEFDEFTYNLSAFVSAWRSVFDVLLYDYTERYFGINREEKIKVTRESFGMASKAIQEFNPEAQRFIEWYNEKIERVLQKEEETKDLWSLRNFLLHKGTHDREVYVPLDVGTCAMSGYIPLGVVDGVVVLREGSELLKVRTFGDYELEQILKMCNKGFDLMTEIVEEAKQNF